MRESISSGRATKWIRWVELAALLLVGSELFRRSLAEYPIQSLRATYLLGMAAAFAGMGILLHSLTSSAPKPDSRQSLRPAGAPTIREKENSEEDSRREVERLRRTIDQLTSQISQRNRDMDELKELADQQVEEIRMLQIEAEAIRRAVAESGRMTEAEKAGSGGKKRLEVDTVSSSSESPARQYGNFTASLRNQAETAAAEKREALRSEIASPLETGPIGKRVQSREACWSGRNGQLENESR